MFNGNGNGNKGGGADIGAELENIQAQIATTKESLDALEAKAKLIAGTRFARGTKRDVSALVPPAVLVQPAQLTLEQRIEQILRERIATLDDLTKSLGAPAGKVAAALKAFRGKNQIANVGREDAPRWTWRIGDGASSKEVRALVERLVTDQPMLLAELVAATGVRASRVGGAIIELQRAPDVKIIDMGTPGRARWFVISPSARDAKLPPKGAPASKK